ncbi:hypothetical protein [Benzoatithermus flavus]|uniref:Uncharacterized protein n=1 Tax=Benzoatithermus flavus TaxID=3108223 RepID=A0ABU8XP91_9PROT
MEHRIVRRPVAALLALGFAGSAPAASVAQADPAAPPAMPGPDAPMCGAYDELRSFLNERFGEQPASMGLADDGTVMQVFASSAAGTWTMVSVDSKGHACVLATGQAWQQEALARQGQPT